MGAATREDVADGVVALLHASQTVVAPENARYPPYLNVDGSTPTFTEGTAECTTSTCSFTGFTATRTLFATYRLSGLVTHEGSETTINIAYAQVGKGGSVTCTLDGAVNTTTASLDGQIHSRCSTGGSYTYLDVTWDVVVDLDGVVLDANGCPIDGSLHASMSYDDDPLASESPRTYSSSFDAKGTLAFGPACDLGARTKTRSTR